MVRTISRFLRLPLSRKALFAWVSLMLLVVNLALRLFPFARVYRFLKRWRRPPRKAAQQSAQSAAAEAVCWAVMRAGTFWLGNEGCLSQALLGEMLLGLPARLCIGIRKEENGAMLAHAWVEASGQILIGGETSLSTFQRFPEIQRVLEQQENRA
jgi:hypothetical protein